jgi:hypothetical protein
MPSNSEKVGNIIYGGVLHAFVPSLFNGQSEPKKQVLDAEVSHDDITSLTPKPSGNDETNSNA